MKQTQHKQLLALLLSRPNAWIPLPEILNLYISQYGRVINDLRNGKHAGKTIHNIENKITRVGNDVHSWFRIVVPVKYGSQMTLGIK